MTMEIRNRQYLLVIIILLRYSVLGAKLGGLCKNNAMASDILDVMKIFDNHLEPAIIPNYLYYNHHIHPIKELTTILLFTSITLVKCSSKESCNWSNKVLYLSKDSRFRLIEDIQIIDSTTTGNYSGIIDRQLEVPGFEQLVTLQTDYKTFWMMQACVNALGFVLNIGDVYLHFIDTDEFNYDTIYAKNYKCAPNPDYCSKDNLNTTQAEFTTVIILLLALKPTVDAELILTATREPKEDKPPLFEWYYGVGILIVILILLAYQVIMFIVSTKRESSHVQDLQEHAAE